MVTPRIRSRKKRQVFTRVTKGTHLRLEKRKPSSNHCADCGAVLHGVLRIDSRKLSRIPKTKKRPQRKYGGMLCSGCSRKRIVEAFRK